MNINGLKTNHIKTFRILSEIFIYFQSSSKYCKPFEERREEGKFLFQGNEIKFLTLERDPAIYSKLPNERTSIIKNS